MTAIDYAATIIAGLINFTAAIALFLLRKFAVGLFATGLALSLALIAWQTATRGLGRSDRGTGLAGALIGYVLMVRRSC